MKKTEGAKWFIGSFVVLALLAAFSQSRLKAQRPASNAEPSEVSEIGRYGGKLIFSQRTEPKTLNPVTAIDDASREIVALFTADLIHINRRSQQSEPALASSWTVSPDGRKYTLRLRRGVSFSDGQPFDADDVLFTFRVYLDEQIHSPQRELLIISGKPIAVQKIDAYTVRFELAEPYAAAERLFDSIAILPRHLLKPAYEKGEFARAWNLNTQPAQIAGLGPFRINAYVPGQNITLERNPHYWKTDIRGQRLPYLDGIVSLFISDSDGQAMRFEAGETDVINRLSAENFSVLEKVQQARGFRLYDLGPGLEYKFLFFNLNDLSSKDFSSIARKQTWFRRLAFRQAISAVIDREGIVRIVYRGRARPLWAHVTPGNKLWVNRNIPQRSRSLEEARRILKNDGFSWRSDGRVIDPSGNAVEFSILHRAGNVQDRQIATIAQEDLKQIGIEMKVVPLESRTFLDRIFKTYEYEAAVISLAGGDTDPNVEMNVWTSQGSTHIWNLGASRARTPWEEEIDGLMHQQLVTLDYNRRKRMYDRVQQLVWENFPLVCLVSPNILVGAKQQIGNFRPAILSSYTLWNAEELFFREHRNPVGRE